MDVPYAYAKPLWWGGSFLSGFLIVVLLAGVVRPLQKDNAHTQGVLTAKGGTVVHGARWELGSGFFGTYTALVTAKVTPPIAGDIKVELTGPTPVKHILSSRFPPVVPLVNKFKPWYRFENNTLKGVKPGDDVAVYVKFLLPSEPGEYHLNFTNAKTGQLYLAMPMVFTQPAGAGAAGDESCH